MKKRCCVLNKKSCLMLLTVLFIGMMGTIVLAAGKVSLKADKTQLAVNDEITVTVKADNPAGAAEAPEITVKYDKDKLEFVSCSKSYGGGGGGLITLSDTSATIKLKAIASGGTTVSVAAILAGDGVDVPTGSVDIQIGGGETSSKNQLKSLTVAEGSLSPEFSPEVTEYKLLVPASVTSIVVSAQPADAKAKVSKVNGFNNLEFGENEGSVTVTGADGSTMDYKIIVTRSESDEPIEEQSIDDDFIPITDSTLMVSTTFPVEMLPAGFEKTEITYEEVAVEAAKFNMGEMLLLYMTDEAGANGAFYIYDTVSGEFMDFIQIQGIEGRFIIIMQPDESVTVPSGFTKATLQWGTKTVSAWMPVAGVSDEARLATGTDKYPAEHILSNIYAGMAKAMVVHAAETTEPTEPEAEGSTATAGVEYFLVYAMSSEGRKGWYLYDSVEGTYQRYLQMAFDNSDGAAGNGERADEGVVDYKKQSNQRFVIICVLAVLLVILLILVFNLFLKLRDAKSDKAEEDIPSLKKKASIQPIRKEPVRLRKARDEMDYLLDRADSGEDEEESYGDSDEDEDDEDIVFEVSPSKKKESRRPTFDDIEIEEKQGLFGHKNKDNNKGTKTTKPISKKESNKVTPRNIKPFIREEMKEDNIEDIFTPYESVQQRPLEENLELDDDFEFEFIDLDE